MALLGGREIHPINVRVGGFYRVPARRELRTLVEPLERAREQTLQMLAWVKGFTFPDFERDYEFVSVSHPDEYPYNEGNIVSSLGLDIPPIDFERHFVEEHAQHSMALQGARRSPVEGHPGAVKSYMTGPLARYSLNFDRLTPAARQAAKDAGLGPVCRNPFRSILVRSVETLYAVEEALRDRRRLRAARRAGGPGASPRAGTGAAATEAPRGMLVHRYRIEADGTIAEARIVPPTAQNQNVHRGGPGGVHRGPTRPRRRRRSPGSASRRCATTTPASPAPRTSSGCTAWRSDRHARHRRRQRGPSDDGAGPAMVRLLRSSGPRDRPPRVITARGRRELLDAWAGVTA